MVKGTAHAKPYFKNHLSLEHDHKRKMFCKKSRMWNSIALERHWCNNYLVNGVMDQLLKMLDRTVWLGTIDTLRGHCLIFQNIPKLWTTWLHFEVTSKMVINFSHKSLSRTSSNSSTSLSVWDWMGLLSFNMKLAPINWLNGWMDLNPGQ